MCQWFKTNWWRWLLKVIKKSITLRRILSPVRADGTKVGMQTRSVWNFLLALLSNRQHQTELRSRFLSKTAIQMKKLYNSFILLGLAVAIIIIGGVSLWPSEESAPFEILVLDHLLPNKTRPVSAEMLAWNPLRIKAGLPPIDDSWRIAEHDFHVTHMALTVLLDPKQRPTKVIKSGLVSSDYTGVTEHSIAKNQLSGKTVTWIGKIPLLWKMEAYKAGKLNGLTTYYSKNGEVLSSLEFKDNRPWTGQLIERAGFDELTWETSYSEGKQDGKERHFAKGILERLRSYKKGILHGVQQDYHQGQLRSESMVADGIVRQYKSWHQNGKLSWEEYFTAKGLRDGIRHGWDEIGNLTTEEGYYQGKLHGLSWYKGHQEVWYWEGEPK